MILVAVTVLLATALGVLCDHRTANAPRLGGWALRSMLWVFVPFVAYVSFAHLELSLAAALGLVVAYLGVLSAGTAAYLVGRRWLHLERPALGGLICTVMLVNTGYLGLPMTVALIGTKGLSHAVAYDQVVSGPMVFTAGFAVGAAFGTHGEDAGLRARVTTFLTRNPPLWAAVAGLLVPVALAPHALVVASHVVVDVLLAIGFFAVGVNLSAERREDHAPLLDRPDRRVGTAMALRFGITPLLFGIVAAAGVAIPGPYFLQAAMPSGINSLIVGHAYGLDQRLIATMIVWSTLAVLAVGLVAYVV
jgi:malate permease and related proteins